MLVLIQMFGQTVGSGKYLPLVLIQRIRGIRFLISCFPLAITNQFTIDKEETLKRKKEINDLMNE